MTREVRFYQACHDLVNRVVPRVLLLAHPVDLFVTLHSLLDIGNESARSHINIYMQIISICEQKEINCRMPQYDTQSFLTQ